MPTHYDADLRLFINGSWRIGEGRDASGVINPATGETIAELPLATAADLDEALASADKGFQTWRAMDVEARGAILRKAATLLRDRTEAIATLLTLEQGKPIAEARAEVSSSAALFDYCAEEAKPHVGSGRNPKNGNGHVVFAFRRIWYPAFVRDHQDPAYLRNP